LVRRGCADAAIILFVLSVLVRARGQQLAVASDGGQSAGLALALSVRAGDGGRGGGLLKRGREGRETERERLKAWRGGQGGTRARAHSLCLSLLTWPGAELTAPSAVGEAEDGAASAAACVMERKERESIERNAERARACACACLAQPSPASRCSYRAGGEGVVHGVGLRVICARVRVCEEKRAPLFLPAAVVRVSEKTHARSLHSLFTAMTMPSLLLRPTVRPGRSLRAPTPTRRAGWPVKAGASCGRECYQRALVCGGREIRARSCSLSLCLRRAHAHAKHSPSSCVWAMCTHTHTHTRAPSLKPLTTPLAPPQKKQNRAACRRGRRLARLARPRRGPVGRAGPGERGERLCWESRDRHARAPSADGHGQRSAARQRRRLATLHPNLTLFFPLSLFHRSPASSATRPPPLRPAPPVPQAKTRPSRGPPCTPSSGSRPGCPRPSAACWRSTSSPRPTSPPSPA
jgi:hypothetical protein